MTRVERGCPPQAASKAGQPFCCEKADQNCLFSASVSVLQTCEILFSAKMFMMRYG